MIIATRKITITSSLMEFREKVRDSTNWERVEAEAMHLVRQLDNKCRLEVDPVHFYRFTVVSNVDGKEQEVIDTANKVIEFMESKNCPLSYTV